MYLQPSPQNGSETHKRDTRSTRVFTTYQIYKSSTCTTEHKLSRPQELQNNCVQLLLSCVWYSNMATCSPRSVDLIIIILISLQLTWLHVKHSKRQMNMYNEIVHYAHYSLNSYYNTSESTYVDCHFLLTMLSIMIA